MSAILSQTLAQKLIARASGRAHVAVGEVVTCNVDLAMFHDSSGPRRLKPMLDELGAEIWDKNKVVLVLDHYVPAQDADAQQIVQIARDTAKLWKLPHVIDSEGICHVVLPERGHLKPGMFCVGGDSHSPTGGAFGCYMFGIGATEMLGVCVTGQIWVQVPRTLRMQWSGRLQTGVSAKDMMLHMVGRFGMNGGQYQAVEFAGAAVQALSMAERMTLSNMSAEMGAQAGLIAADETTLKYLRGVGLSSGTPTKMPSLNSTALMLVPSVRKWPRRTARRTRGMWVNLPMSNPTSHTSVLAPVPSSKTCVPLHRCSKASVWLRVCS